jgi:hypothetical protein
MTSMEGLTGRVMDFGQAKREVIGNFLEVFEMERVGGDTGGSSSSPSSSPSPTSPLVET